MAIVRRLVGEPISVAPPAVDNGDDQIGCGITFTAAETMLCPPLCSRGRHRNFDFN